MIITFAGHSTVSSQNKIKEIVKEQIRINSIDVDYVTCYLGGYGEFNDICASACRELKQENGKFEIVYITPYLGFSEQAKIKENQLCGF